MMKRNASNGGAREPHQIRMRPNRTPTVHAVVLQPWRAVFATATLALLAAPLTGCELVLGMTGHDAQQQPADTSTGDAPGDTASDAPVDAPPAVCTLPSTGDALARVTNVVPALGKLDFCFKPATGAAIGPILGTPGCAGGLTYKESTATFAIPGGTYEVDVIKGGGKCSDAPVASVKNVTFDTGTTSNSIVMGDGASDVAVKTLRETAPTTIASKFRFIHAIDGAPNQDCGLTTKPSLPATITSLYFKNVAFGTTAPAGTSPGGTIDANGYGDFAGSGAALSFGRANTGTPDIIDMAPVKLVSRIGYSLYAIGKTDSAGKPNDAKFPTEILVCNEHDVDGVYARCANAIPVDVTFDVVNTQLNGAFAQLESLRRGPLNAAIAGLGGDVACVTEVWSETDKDAIINAAKSKYPYAARFKADLTTPLDDAKDQAGNVPAAPTTAACADPADKALLETYLTCATTNCAVTKGDPNSTVQDQPAACLADKCGGEAVNLALSAPRCWDCNTVQSFGRATFAATKTACETDPLARYAFGGANGVVVLSRFPFDGTPEVVNMGATDFRVALVRAPLLIDGGAKVDAYCTVLTTPATGVTRPYVGDYGGGGADTDTQWRNELLLQVGKVANQVATRSGALKKRAVVLGDWYTGPKVGTLTDLNVESYVALTAAMPLALVDGFTPQCTYCADNPIYAPPGTMPSGASYWSSYGVLSGIPVTDVRANEVILKKATIPVPMATYNVPVSPYYGFRTVVRIRP
jgi:hypothetical protein